MRILPEPRWKHSWRRSEKGARRGAALRRVSRPDSICSTPYLTETDEKQAAPANDPAFGCSIGLSHRALDQNKALGNSREPPALSFPSRNTRWSEMLSGLTVRAKAAPLQARPLLELLQLLELLELPLNLQHLSPVFFVLTILDPFDLRSRQMAKTAQ